MAGEGRQHSEGFPTKRGRLCIKPSVERCFSVTGLPEEREGVLLSSEMGGELLRDTD